MNDATPPPQAEMPPAWRSWIERRTGGALVSASLQPGARRAWSLTVDRPQGPTPFFLRGDRGEAFALNRTFTLAREVEVLRALRGQGIPVPEVIDFHPEYRAALLAFVPGRSDFHRIDDPQEREAVAADFLGILARWHSVPPDRFGLPSLPCPATAVEHALGPLRFDEQLVADLPRTEPAVRFALRWLRDHPPSQVSRTVLVQGDTGPGNFLFADGRVTAVVDWELAHFGDPVEDLAWICARDLVTPFGDLPRRFAEYSRLSGVPVDRDRLLYYRVAAMTRVVVAVDAALAHHGSAVPHPLLPAWRALYLRAGAEALAQAWGIALDEGARDESESEEQDQRRTFGRTWDPASAELPGPVEDDERIRYFYRRARRQQAALGSAMMGLEKCRLSALE